MLAESWQIVAKALHPIPFGAFNDPEARLRQRATDLIVHPEAAEPPPPGPKAWNDTRASAMR